MIQRAMYYELIVFSTIQPMSSNSKAPRPRGCPRKVYVSSGWHAALQRAFTIFSSDEEPSKRENEESMIAAALPLPLPTPSPLPTLPTLSLHEKLKISLASARPTIKGIFKSKGYSEPSAALFLDRITRLGPLWKDLGTLHTADLPFWFDAQVSYSPLDLL